MAKIVLIACVSKKQAFKAKARELYASPLFQYSFQYAQTLHPNKIYILSAKHGLLSPEEVIAPYNASLYAMNKEEVEKWAERVIAQLNAVADLRNDTFVFLAGEKYRKYLTAHIHKYTVPLKGLGIGKQLQYLKKKVQS